MALITTLTFLCLFFPLSLLMCAIIPNRRKGWMLLLTSLVFWCIADADSLLLMVVMAVAVLFYSRCSLLLRQKKRLLLVITVCFLLMQIAAALYWQYRQQRRFAASGSIFQYTPIGISFFILQSIHCTVKTYRSERIACQPIQHLLVYLLCYPMLLMGPVEDFDTFQRQLSQMKMSGQAIGKGMILLIRGLAKKVLLADGLWVIFQPVYGTIGADSTLLLAWLSLIGVLLSFFLTVSGYADMAQGIAECYGIHLSESYRGNVLFGSTSKNFSENWNRTVTAWFGRCIGAEKPAGAAWTMCRQILMWGMIGLWYRCSAETVLWGVWTGFLIGFETLMKQRNILLNRTPVMVLRIVTILMTCMGWMLFFSWDMEAWTTHMAAMFFASGKVFITPDLHYLQSGGILLLLSLYVSTDHFNKVISSLKRNKQVKRIYELMRIPAYVFLLVMSLAAITAQSGIMN